MGLSLRAGVGEHYPYGLWSRGEPAINAVLFSLAPGLQCSPVSFHANEQGIQAQARGAAAPLHPYSSALCEGRLYV